jgi:hypothetical protein
MMFTEPPVEKLLSPAIMLTSPPLEAAESPAESLTEPASELPEAPAEIVTAPDLDTEELPVDISISPVAVAPSAVVIVSDPLCNSVLEPDLRFTLPPVDAVDVPAAIENVPPFLELLAPMEKTKPPAAPAAAFPVETDIAPESPRLESPELMEIAPLGPSDMDSSLRIVTLPLAPEVLLPLESKMLPPVCSSLLPAIRFRSVPTPEPESPTLMEIFPADPAAEEPDLRITSPV